MDTPPLEIAELRKSYGGIEVLHGVDLTVRPGEVLGFFGPNGAGKSTTLRIAMGFARASNGRCRLYGRPAGDPEARRAVGYLSENPVFYHDLTGVEVATMAGELHGLDRSTARDRAVKGLARVGLGAARDCRVQTYSKGMRQRLGLVQALVVRPSLLVLDEPFTGLDPIGRRLLKQQLLEFREEGGSVFFSSHQLLDAQEVCDRVALLAQGRIVLEEDLPGLAERFEGETLEGILLRVVEETCGAPADLLPGAKSVVRDGDTQ